VTETIARFTHPGGVDVDVLRGDVRQVESDVLILGRVPELRYELTASTGRSFEPWPWPSSGGVRPPTHLDLAGAGLPWRHVIGVNRKVHDVNWRPRHRGATPHALSLVADLDNLLSHAEWKLGAKSIAILPLSARHRDVVSRAVVAAVHRVAGASASLDAAPALRELLDAIGQGHLLPPRREGRLRFILIDREDPLSWIGGLTNADACLTECELVTVEAWRRSPFERVE